MRLVYHTLDVFTDTRFAGNPLAVVLNADGFDEALMQSIAREFNLSETVFVQKPENRAHAARIRIFTTMRELPFAGHPTIGAAALLAKLKFGDEHEHEAIVSLEEQIGIVRAGVVIRPDAAIHAAFDAPELPQECGQAGNRDEIGATFGLAPNEIGFDNHRPTVFTAGVPYAFVPVCDRNALARAYPAEALWRRGGLAKIGAAYLYCRETRDPAAQFAARMFSPGLGLIEDPATGSAAAAFAGVIARFESLGDKRHVLTIEQGYDMGRPSLITLEVVLAAGRLQRARIGGDSVFVARGEIDI